MTKIEEVTAMRTNQLLRRGLTALVLSTGLSLGGCDDAEGGGVGASISLPAAFANGLNDPTDIGVGNVHWVGNPRW